MTEAVLCTMDAREADGNEPPAPVAAALAAADVFVAPTSRSLSHTRARKAATVAFGASAGIGGTVAVPIHLDSVVLEPTLDIGGTRVLEAGHLVLDA